MPARPLPDASLRLIAALWDALAERLGAEADVQERQLFGCHAFMVNGKLCLAVKGEELLVRLPPAEHAATAETPGVRELDAHGMPGYFWITPAAYATRAQWRHWIDAALAYNPQAKATPRRAKARKPEPTGLPPSPPGRGPG
ncbi:MAG: TfoX/Sxy family protein [Proteobacteria bacterium]|nr:TfoX/Sxy family protein [Pseudomonadota bacterium]MBS0492354.1 TfoX/Sxy family protein [Pseudomonadota bacterium]